MTATSTSDPCLGILFLYKAALIPGNFAFKNRLRGHLILGGNRHLGSQIRLARTMNCTSSLFLLSRSWSIYPKLSNTIPSTCNVNLSTFFVTDLRIIPLSRKTVLGLVCCPINPMESSILSWCMFSYIHARWRRSDVCSRQCSLKNSLHVGASFVDLLRSNLLSFN